MNTCIWMPFRMKGLVNACILAAIATLACLMQESSAQDVSVTGETLLIDLSKKKWGKSSFETKETTPDGNSPAALSIPPSGKLEYIVGDTPNSFPKSLAGMELDWDSFSFWVKPDNSGYAITMVFWCKDPKGLDSLYTHTFKLIGDKWVNVNVSSLWCKDGAQNRMKLSHLRAITFYGASKDGSHFLIGPLAFNLSGAVGLDPVKTVDAVKVSRAPVIDGNLDDECWKGISGVNRFSGTLSNPAEVKIAYDNEFIYAMFSQSIDTSKLVKDQKSSDGSVWSDDSFQFIISPQNDDKSFHQFIVNAANVHQTFHSCFDQVKDDFVLGRNLFPEKWSSAVSVEPSRWNVELKIARSAMKGLDEASTHGLQIFVNNPSTKELGLWSSPNGEMNAVKAENFGVVHFASEKPLDHSKAMRLNANLFFNGMQPRVLLDMNGDGSSMPVSLRLSAPNAGLADSAGDYPARKLYSFGSYIPKSGCHRLTVSLGNDDAKGSVYGFKTKPVVFTSQIPYGEEILNPSVKSLSKKPGSFSASNGMAILVKSAATGPVLHACERLRDDFAGYLQASLPIKESPSIPENSISIAFVTKPDSEWTAPSSLSRKDAYCLRIGENRIDLRGESPAALLYAAITLSQLERYAFIRNEMSLACVEIEDWPDLPFRIWANWFDVLYSKYLKSTKGADSPEETLNVVYEYLDRVAIDSKMNVYSPQNPTSIRDYRNQALSMFSDPRAYMTIKDLGEMAKHCKANNVEFVPGLSGPSHANWITSRVPETLMPGYGEYDADPTNAKFANALFAMQDELIAATKPRFFFQWLDEWWHQPKGDVSTSYKGMEKRDIFYDTVLRVHRNLTDKGCKMLMFSDMLQRDHNGGKPYDNYLNAPKLPKDIIMCSWSGGESSVKQFAELGYMSWYLGNHYGGLDSRKLKNVGNFTGLGVINYGSATPCDGYGAAGMLKTADLAWNFQSDRNLSFPDWLFQNGSSLMGMYSVRPNPCASRDFEPLDIGAFCNDSYVNSSTEMKMAGLPQGDCSIGFIPTKIGSEAKALNVLKGESTPIAIPVGRRAASIVFLHTQCCPAGKIKDFISQNSTRKSGSYKGLKTGTYTLVFSNGKRTDVHIQNTMNCANWKPFPGSSTSELENKYLLDSRFTWESQERDPKMRTCLFQYEWVNPHPEIDIDRIEFISTGTEATPYLFAITIRKPLL